ncbi:MAG TPA: hypothetical protein VI796_03555 [Candidatus Thermoplasmatota archaeon]|nr:hypothetical protein [Candidatus Thermoplasmatota archaeon]
MNLTHLLTLGLVGTVSALAGCAGAGAESTLEYDGIANGTHSDSVNCDDQGTINGSGNVPDGSVLITLKDSEGKQLLRQSFSGDFTLAKTAVSGASGAWSFQAQRSGDDLVGDAFSGDYAFHVNC